MGVTPTVSIVIVNHNHPEIINICLRSLSKTGGIPYEVVVVDNGSNLETATVLNEHYERGRIDRLVLEPVNHYFSEGNNIGVKHSSQDSEYVLLLNSDIGIVRPDWLVKLVAWAEGTAKYWPTIWNLRPTVPKPGPLDIVSMGWSYDGTVQPSLARPEGFCCLIRRSAWQDMSQDFPWYYGFEEMVTKVIRAGHRCGVLCQYGSYFVHREAGSWSKATGDHPRVVNAREPDMPGWFAGLEIETLDFTLGPNEHDSYLEW